MPKIINVVKIWCEFELLPNHVHGYAINLKATLPEDLVIEPGTIVVVPTCTVVEHDWDFCPTVEGIKYTGRLKGLTHVPTDYQRLLMLGDRNIMKTLVNNTNRTIVLKDGAPVGRLVFPGMPLLKAFDGRTKRELMQLSCFPTRFKVVMPIKDVKYPDISNYLVDNGTSRPTEMAFYQERFNLELRQ